jgi:hypothetical protein
MLMGIGHLEDIRRCRWEDNIKMAATEIGRRMRLDSSDIG